ncbi:aromatic ring-hydroxylating dioxygenase subunit alpha [Iodidimonas sp. SYSU 1G8]|uniref:aromatic ring-hydroxylating oxygenase subunit alpha n=1 Tax=Iodidimonas sp. SYSU 1G8 TaxID=3133967 RepID=UPI0031FF0CAE
MATKAEDVVGRTPPFDPAKPLPDLGSEPISGERFHSRDWMDKEWTRMWRRVWNMAFRASDVPEPGDTFTYELGKESFVFVRGHDGRIRGFYNVCQHRGNLLMLNGEGCGHVESFHCGYHGWQWNLEGVLQHIPDVETYPQFRDGVPAHTLGMEPVETDIWGGWVWFKMDPGGPSLLEFLDPIPAHLDPYEIEKWDIIDYKTFEWRSNWKAVCDAFNESYHFQALHPQMMQWSNGMATVELLGIHSRMVNEYGTVDPRYHDQKDPGPEMRQFMGLLGIDPDTFDRPPQEVRLELQRLKRSVQDKTHLPYRKLRDDQLSDTYHYTIFPNVSWNVTSETINGFRYRPHPSDPNISYYDLIIMRHAPPGVPKMDYTHRVIPADSMPRSYRDVLDMDMHPIISKVLEQDGANLGAVQRGLSSDGFRGMVLCDQELRVRLFHQVVEDYVEGRR